MNSTGQHPSWDELHYRLVSLRELLMYHLKLGDLLQAVNCAVSLNQVLSLLSRDQSFGSPFSHFDQITSAIQTIGDVGADLDLGLDRAANRVLAILESASRDETTASLNPEETQMLQAGVAHLVTRFADDFFTRVVLVIPPSKGSFFDPATPIFGADVASKFSSDAGWEIEEAGKCLALGRDTACVFHLMRTMEVALESLRVCLGLPQPLKPQDKNWGAILQNYKNELVSRENPQSQRRWNSERDKDFFVEIYGSLDAVKEAWRNKTMHVEKTYTTEQAEQVLAVVKGFMQKVASRLDESGQPFA